MQWDLWARARGGACISVWRGRRSDRAGTCTGEGGGGGLIAVPFSGGQGGGEIAVWGGRIQLRKIAEKLRENCGKLREIAGKLRKNCDVVSGPPEPSRCNNSGQVAQNSQNFTETNSLWAVQLQEAPLNITVELQHEPKAADVVIQFVLRLVASGKGSRAGGRGLRGTCACD